MKILLTGHKGFIGSHFASSLSKYDLDLYEPGDQLPEIKQYDWVIHTGAISSTTEKNVELVMEKNYDFSVDLYRECRFWGVNFQFSSSASIYGKGKEFKETSPADPQTPYAWSKYMFERFVTKYPPKNSVVQIFRYFNVYGPNEEHKGEQASVHYKFSNQAKTLGLVRVFEGSANYYRDFIHVDDVVKIQQKFLDIPESGIYNLGSGKAQSILDVAKMYSSKIVEVPMPEVLKSSYQEYTCADMSKTNQMLQKYHI